MRVPISWDGLWIEMAKLISRRSKDPNTQVGAVVVSPDNKRIAVGYNGFPAGQEETPELWESPTKYDHVVHAEMNALLHANTDTTGWTLYVTHPPCNRCAPLVMNAGIKRIVYSFLPNKKSVFEFRQTFEKYEKAGIEVIRFSP
jgi:dCMP deaminase